MTKDHARWRWMWTNLHRGQHPHAWSGAQAAWAPREQRQEIEPHQGLIDNIKSNNNQGEKIRAEYNDSINTYRASSARR